MPRFRQQQEVSFIKCISGWIFQKELAEIVQKGHILSQKALILNHRNFGLFAPKSNRKISHFNR